MALPNIIWPSALPTWQLPGYTARPQDRYAMVRWASGASRRRRLFTAAPVDVTANLYLSTAQAELLDAFFERGLVVGERTFAAPFMGLDGVTTWYTALFAQPPQWTPRSGLRWDVQAALRLTGDGEASAPTPSSLTLRATARLSARADAQVTLPLVLFVSAQLDGAVG
jgi:hypothetical protein